MALNIVVKSLGSGLPPDLQLCHLPDVWAWQVTRTTWCPSKRQSKAGKGNVRMCFLEWSVWGQVGGSASKESACNVGDLGLIPVLGRSPGEGNSYPLQYSGVENSMDCIVHGVAKSWTRLATFTHLPHTKHVGDMVTEKGYSLTY